MAARIRVDRETAPLLYAILYEERGRLIDEKIDIRESGDDNASIRRQLLNIKKLMEETQRAIDDLDREESPRSLSGG